MSTTPRKDPAIKLRSLYNADAGGVFYQLYSNPSGNGFPFEIVRRVSGFGDSDAANASCRTAALKRSVQAVVAA